MKRSLRSRVPLVLAVLLAAAAGGCFRRAVVIVPSSDRSYTARDTLYGTSRGNQVRVTFRHDTTWRTDTVVRLDTIWMGGARMIYRVDTVRVVRRDTIIRRDTVRIRVPAEPVAGVVTGRNDSLRAGPPPPRPGPGPARVDTVRIIVRDTIRVVVRDTVRIVLRDTVVRWDTVFVTPRRTINVPPGQYPPEGQCRVWIPGVPPGQQASSAPCDQLGAIPRGAFILFAGEAWEFDYDWIAESRRSRVPEVIVALKRRSRP